MTTSSCVGSSASTCVLPGSPKSTAALSALLHHRLPACLPVHPSHPAVPLAIGGAGLPADVKLRDDLPEAGLANVAATVFELLGYAVSWRRRLGDWGTIGDIFWQLLSRYFRLFGRPGRGLATSKSSVSQCRNSGWSICTRRDLLGGRLAGAVVNWTAARPHDAQRRVHCAPLLSFLCLQPPPHMLPSLLA
jgi:hypothetical protein